MSASFTSYVAERRPALLRAARAITHDDHAAEDLLQAALVSVMPHWHSLRDRRAADSYVRRTMVNQHISWTRQPRWRHELTVAQLPDRVVAVGEDGDSDGLEATMWSLVAELPPSQRATIVLRFWEGMSVSETAAALGCSTGTVKSNTHHALAGLRRRVALPQAG